MDREDPVRNFCVENDFGDFCAMSELREELPFSQSSSYDILSTQLSHSLQTGVRQDHAQIQTDVMSVRTQPLNPGQTLGDQPDVRYFSERAERGEALAFDHSNTNARPVSQAPEENGLNPVDLLMLQFAAMPLRGAASFVDPTRAVETRFNSADDSKAERRGFYGHVGGLDGKSNRKNKSSRKKKRKALADQRSECGNVLCTVDQRTKESSSDTAAENPIVEKWDELLSDNWKELMPCCARCQVELASGQGLRCPRCHVARYCGNHCKNKDAKRHKPTCLRIFAFNAADAKWKEEAGDFKKLAESLAPELPEFVSGLRPASFFIGSVPNPDRFQFIGMPVPVLLEITSEGLAVDNKSWELTVQDVASMSAYISIDTNETSVPLQRPENIYIAKNLRVGNFILIKNACGVCAEEDSFQIELGKPFVHFIFVGGVNLIRNGES